jgi:sugar phosphate isomerase/epimerase
MTQPRAGAAHLDRRRFLQTGAAAALGLAAGTRLAAAADKEDPFGGFLVGAQSYTFRHFDLEQTLKHMKDLGLHYAEFYQKHVPAEATPEQLAAVLKLCKEYEVTPRAWGVQGFTKDTDKNRKYFELAKALGLKMLSADPDPDAFDSLDKLCDEYKIAIGIHPHGPQGDHLHRWYSAKKILPAVKDHNELIGTCLDTGHLIRAAQLGEKLDPVEEVRMMGARNYGIHLKDWDNDSKPPHEVVAGRGVLDIPGLLKALRDVKFQGMISIEYEAKEEEPSEDVLLDIKAVKDAVRKIA